MKYTQTLVDSFYYGKNCGTISGADVMNKLVNKETGDAVKLFLVINNSVIENAMFQACGSVVLFASMSAIIDMIKGNTLEHAKEINEKSIIREIKQVSRCDYGIVSFAVCSLQQTIRAYEKKLAKQTEQTAEKKAVKVRDFNSSKNITVYTEKAEEEAIEPKTSMIDFFINETKKPIKEVKKAEKAPKKAEKLEIKQKKEAITGEILGKDKFEDIDVKPAVSKKRKVQKEVSEAPKKEVQHKSIKQELVESVPTKIEIRVLEEEEKPKKAPVKKSVAKKSNKAEKNEKTTPDYLVVQEEHSQDDDVIDEIDTITAKLTDAISQLNFKFDDPIDE